jgi:hypothetical protein
MGDWDYVEGHFQHGMIWVYGVVRIGKENECWWDDENHSWKTGAPEDRSFKVLGRFPRRQPAMKLMQDLKDKSGEESASTYVLLRVMLHRTEASNWLAGRRAWPPSGALIGPPSGY